MQEYKQFLQTKRVQSEQRGLQEFPAMMEVAYKLFPFQSAIVCRALAKGAFAVFADCGMGKSRMQIAWSDSIVKRTSGDVLILCPLAVAAQTVREGAAIGVTVTLCRSQADVKPGVNVANYDRLDHFDTDSFVGIALDESSILKNFTGATKQKLLAAFAQTQYRSCWTATPAPNDTLELGNHADFLGIMPSNEMIMRWFINDAAQAGNYRLKGHAASDFWRWVSTWAVSLSKPSDIGTFADSGYELPALNVITHVVECGDLADKSALAEGRLIGGGKLSATKIHGVMRETCDVRAAKVAELVAAKPDTPWIVWCNTDYEADALKAAIPEAVEVRGSDSIENKESRLNDFSEGRTRVLITKPRIAGFGMNWQHCRDMAFVGLSYSYEQFYQSVRRSLRFGQTHEVNAHVVHTENEADVLLTINRKRESHETMKREMFAAMRHVASEKGAGDRFVRELPRRVETGAGWEMQLGDCCDLVRGVESNSVGLSVFSPPFANLYIYSDHEADMGNCKNDAEFFDHFQYLVAELLRVTIPGRNCAIHCKDLPVYKGRDGAAGLSDFPGRIIRAMESAGWTFHSRVTIWKDPVVEMHRTKNHGLLYKNLRSDSSGSRQGMADYMVVFRKHRDENNDVSESLTFPCPVAHTAEDFTLDQWQKWASPVWMDINQMNVLNYQLAKEGGDEKHICPLQLDVIERSVKLWSNPGDLVLSPFAGIGSEGYQSLLAGRKFIGFELKPAYFDHAVANLGIAEVKQSQQSLAGDLFAGEPITTFAPHEKEVVPNVPVGAESCDYPYCECDEPPFVCVK